MSALERWLIAGLVLLAILFAGVGLWQQSRYAGAQSAVREFVRLEQSTERDTRALAKAARPEIRRYLAEGDFSAAQKRLAALRAEDRASEDPEIRGKGITMEALWPPASKERETARLVLKRLVERQAQGYEMAPAHAALVRVAEEARKGDRKRALAAFQDVEKQVSAAGLRPGFQPSRAVPARAGGPPGPAGAAPGRDMPPLTDRQVQGVQRMFQFIRPEMLEQLPEERRAFLRRVQPLGDEIADAHRQGRDVRPLIRNVYPMIQALREGEMDLAEALLEKIRAAIPSLPPRPPALRNPGGAPPGASLPGLPPGPAPQLPALPGLPGGSLAAVSPERILQALDSIRALPEAEYQKQRPTMAMMLAQVMAAGIGTAGPEAPRNSLTLGDPAQISLEFGPRGEMTGLRARGGPLSAGLPAGGYFRVEDGKPDIPLSGALRKTAEGMLLRAAVRGAFKAEYRVDGKALVLQAETTREREGPPAALVLRLPLRAGGWRWTAGAEPAVIAIDQLYEAKPGEGGTLPPVTIGGPGFALSIQAPGAESVRLEPGEGRLSIRFPLPKSRGTTTWTVRLHAVLPGSG